MGHGGEMKIITKGCSLWFFSNSLLICLYFNQYFLWFSTACIFLLTLWFFLAIIYCKAPSIQAGISSIYFRYLTETLLPQWNFRCLSPGRDKRSSLIPQLCCMGRGHREALLKTCRKWQLSLRHLECLLLSTDWKWAHSASGQSQPAARTLISSWKLIWNTPNTLLTQDPASLSLLQDWR